MLICYSTPPLIEAPDVFSLGVEFGCGLGSVFLTGSGLGLGVLGGVLTGLLTFPGAGRCGGLVTARGSGEGLVFLVEGEDTGRLIFLGRDSADWE